MMLLDLKKLYCFFKLYRSNCPAINSPSLNNPIFAFTVLEVKILSVVFVYFANL